MNHSGASAGAFCRSGRWFQVGLWCLSSEKADTFRAGSTLSTFGACSTQDAAHACLHMSAGPRGLSTPHREGAQAVADVLGSAWPMLACTCVCCQCRTHKSLPDHRFDLELGSYLPSSQQPLQIMSSLGSQRGAVSGVVTASLGKAPVSPPITPAAAQPARRATLRTLRTRRSPWGASAPHRRRSPLHWRESGYSSRPCEWKNPPVSAGPVLDSWETLTSINTTKLFLHMAKYLCKPISSRPPLLTWRRQALSLRWIYLLSGGFQTLHIPLRHCFLLQKDLRVLEASTWWEKGERKKKEKWDHQSNWLGGLWSSSRLWRTFVCLSVKFYWAGVWLRPPQSWSKLGLGSLGSSGLSCHLHQHIFLYRTSFQHCQTGVQGPSCKWEPGPWGYFYQWQHQIFPAASIES